MSKRTAKRPLLKIDIRDQRLPGGRLAISARTRTPKVAEAREAMLRKLIDRGSDGLALIARLTSRDPGQRLRLEQLEDAYDAESLDTLRPVVDERSMLGASIDRLLQTVRGTKEPKTVEQYTTLANHLERYFGVQREAEAPEEGEPRRILRDVDMAGITTQDAQGFLTAPHASNGRRPWAPSRQHVNRVIAQKLWRAEIRRQADLAERTNARPLLKLNPWEGVELPKVRKTRVAWLKPAEWRTLAARTEGRPVLALLALGCLAGLRLQEALNLRTDLDVDFEADLIRVQPREGAHAWKTKTDRSIRDVPMCAELRAILLAHREAGFAGERYFVRSARRDQPLQRETARQWVKEAMQDAGLKYGRHAGDAVTFHSLRHTFASWMLQRRISVFEVAELIGDTVEMVTDVYGHLAPHNKRQAVAALDVTLQEQYR